MPRDVLIRPEGPADHAAIHDCIAMAFDRDDEARLVAALRASRWFIPELSLVAVREGRVVGHVLFSPIEIVHNDRPVADALALAPLAVRPEVQDQGIGSQLARAGLDTCRERGNRLVIVVGHPTYYPRFGFKPAGPFGLECPFEVSDGAFMVCELVAGAVANVRGLVRYPPPFSAF
ncbi:MAG: N-acetyltransferase [Planctomycetia bacterium]|nr:N-acetyltransferase [Planctomycetia bacterium]